MVFPAKGTTKARGVLTTSSPRENAGPGDWAEVGRSQPVFQFPFSPGFDRRLQESHSDPLYENNDHGRVTEGLAKRGTGVEAPLFAVATPYKKKKQNL